MDIFDGLVDPKSTYDEVLEQFQKRLIAEHLFC